MNGILIFDLDGTLFRTETVTVPAVQQAFAECGLPAPPAGEICSLIGRPESVYKAWLSGRSSPSLADRIVRVAVERELALIGATGELYPGAHRALDELRRVVAVMAVCSHGSRRYVEPVLWLHGIAGLFDLVRYRTPSDGGKPPMVADILRRYGAVPGQRVVIGDRDDDIEAAHFNGLRAVGCAYGYGADGELDAADLVASSPSDLPRLVRRLLGSASPPPDGRIHRRDAEDAEKPE
ncbi:MAG: HAD family hydrolase [Planctomycetota bacterium]|jgi:phosphoglycolate phosphatase-like HAD superfamily hydrolase